MLLLNRREGEKIVIGDGITLTVLEIDAARNRVRLGIDAPRDVLVRREELAHVPPIKPEDANG